MINDHNDYDDIDDDWSDGEHGSECDCDDCLEEDAWSECSYMVEHGGCTQAGSEFCDWECPMRRMLDKEAE